MRKQAEHMKIRQPHKMKRLILVLLLAFSLNHAANLLLVVEPVVAQPRFTDTSSSSPKEVEQDMCTGDAKTCLEQNGIVKIINAAIVLIAGVAGIAISGMLIAGGIRYSAAGGDPGAVQKAKKMISNAIIALLAFIFLGAFLEWLVPGGLIR